MPGFTPQGRPATRSTQRKRVSTPLKPIPVVKQAVYNLRPANVKPSTLAQVAQIRANVIANQAVRQARPALNAAPRSGKFLQRTANWLQVGSTAREALNPAIQLYKHPSANNALQTAALFVPGPGKRLPGTPFLMRAGDAMRLPPGASGTHVFHGTPSLSTGERIMKEGVLKPGTLDRHGGGQPSKDVWTTPNPHSAADLYGRAFDLRTGDPRGGAVIGFPKSLLPPSKAHSDFGLEFLANSTRGNVPFRGTPQSNMQALAARLARNLEKSRRRR